MANVAKQLNAYAKELSYGNQLPKLRGVDDLYGLRAYGEKVMESPDYISEFTGTFFKIAMMVIYNKVFENPFDIFFKKIDYGVGVEEVFVEISKPLKHDPFGDGAKVWERVMPDAHNKLHLLNVDFDVIKTVYEKEIAEAFYSYEGMNSWWSAIITSINNGVSTTIFSICKYMIAWSALDQGTATLYLDETNPRKTVKSLKALSTKLKFPSPLYNRAGVNNFTNKRDLYLFVTPEFNAELEVEVLAYMFNVEYGKVDFHVIELDDFTTHDYNALGNAFPNGLPHEFTDEELEALGKMQGLLCSRDYLFFYNFRYRQSSKYNDRKGYWNLFTRWNGMVSTSPFEPAVAMLYGDAPVATGISNPYNSDKLRVGRMNLFYAYPAKLNGILTETKNIVPTVTGTGLLQQEGMPGWYQASNNKGDTATLTYTSTNPSFTKSVSVEII